MTEIIIDETMHIYAQALKTQNHYAISKHTYEKRITPLKRKYGKMSQFDESITINAIELEIIKDSDTYEETNKVVEVRVCDLYCGWRTLGPDGKTYLTGSVPESW